MQRTSIAGHTGRRERSRTNRHQDRTTIVEGGHSEILRAAVVHRKNTATQAQRRSTGHPVVGVVVVIRQHEQPAVHVHVLHATGSSARSAQTDLTVTDLGDRAVHRISAVHEVQVDVHLTSSRGEQLHIAGVKPQTIPVREGQTASPRSEANRSTAVVAAQQAVARPIAAAPVVVAAVVVRIQRIHPHRERGQVERAACVLQEERQVVRRVSLATRHDGAPTHVEARHRIVRVLRRRSSRRVEITRALIAQDALLQVDASA